MWSSDAPKWGWLLFLCHSGLRGLVGLWLNSWYREFYDMVSADQIERAGVVSKLFEFGWLVSPLLVAEPLLVWGKNRWCLSWRLALVRRLTGVN